jgi:4-amino-4-deoxy-L-arabinose transferase-like glycosyltransferase
LRADRVLVALLLAALALRVVLVVATPDYQPFADALDYADHARSIAAGHGYPPTLYAQPGSPSALRPPVYPLLLGGAWALDGQDGGRILAALLGMLTVLLVYLLARELADRRAARVAAALAAVFPPLVMLGAGFLSEQAFLPLMLGALLAAIRFRRDGALRWAPAAGALCGLAALTRPVGVALLMPVLIALWWPRRRWLAPLAALAVAALVIAPWTVRNAIQLHAFVPISTTAGPTAAGTYNDEANSPGPGYALWRPPQFVRAYAPLLHARLDEAELNGTLGRLSRSYAFHHPGYALEVTAYNALRLFDVGPGHTLATRTFYEEMGVPPSLRAVTTASAWIALALALAGGVLLRRRFGFRHRFVWLAPALLLAASVPITAGERFRAPVDPFLVVLAAVAVVTLAARSRPHGPRGPHAADARSQGALDEWATGRLDTAAAGSVAFLANAWNDAVLDEAPEFFLLPSSVRSGVSRADLPARVVRRAARRLLRREPPTGAGADLSTLTPEDRRIVEHVAPYTMTGVPRVQAVIEAVRYCVGREVEGAFAECGVWRGGSVLAMILTLQELGVADRDIWLYDTFEGMTEPGERDRSWLEGSALEAYRDAQAAGKKPWGHFFDDAVFDEAGVRETILSTGYPESRLHFVRGRVEDTIPERAPESLAILRLDTDWYESTRHELIHLYPRLVSAGVLIIDDYGHWEGARRAVDQYFEREPRPLLNWIDYAARIGLKT